MLTVYLTLIVVWTLFLASCARARLVRERRRAEYLESLRRFTRAAVEVASTIARYSDATRDCAAAFKRFSEALEAPLPEAKP